MEQLLTLRQAPTHWKNGKREISFHIFGGITLFTVLSREPCNNELQSMSTLVGANSTTNRKHLASTSSISSRICQLPPKVPTTSYNGFTRKKTLDHWKWQHKDDKVLYMERTQLMWHQGEYITTSFQKDIQYIDKLLILLS